MKKIVNLILVLIILAIGNKGFCEKLPNDLTEYSKAGAYSEYKQYFQEYFDILEKAYRPQEHFPKRMYNGTHVNYFLHKDGTISDLKIINSSVEDYEYINPLYSITRMRVRKYGPIMDEYVVSTIKNNLPKPFRRQMEENTIQMDIQLCYLNNEEKYLDISSMPFTRSDGKYLPPTFMIILTINSFK